MVTVTRAYSGRLFGLDGDLAWSHHSMHNRAVAQLFSDMLSIRGGVETSLADSDDPIVQRFRRCLLASWWLSVESPHDLNEEWRIDRKSLDDRLAEIVGDDAPSWFADVGPILNGAVRDGSVWVDRRAAWEKHWSQWKWRDVWNDVVAMSGLDIAELFKASDVDLARVNGWERPPKGFVFPNARSFASARFGSGGKSDFALFVQRLDALLQVDWEGIGSGQHYQDTLDQAIGSAGLFDSLQHNAVPRLRKEYARLSALDVWSREDAVQWQEVLAKEFVEGQSKAVRAGHRDWAVLLLDRLIAATGVPRQFWTANALDAVLNGAQGKIASTTSINRRRLLELLEIHHALSEPIKAEHRSNFKALTSFQERRTTETAAMEPYRVGSRAIKGWKQIRERFAACESVDARVEAINSVREAGVHVGDQSLFEFVARDPQLLDSLDAFAVRDDLRAKGRHRFVPTSTIPDPTAHPAFAQFGKNNWSWRNSRSDPRGVVLSLWDGRQFVDTEAVLVAGRIDSDTASKQGAPRAARADRRGRLAAAGSESAAVAVATSDKVGGGTMTLAFNRTEFQRLDDKSRPRRWHALIALQLEPAGPLDRYVDRTGLRVGSLRSADRPAGVRVLGVDLGLRTLAAWAIWETVDQKTIDRIRTQPLVALDQGAEWVRVRHPGGEVDNYRRLAPPTKGDVTAPWARLVTCGSISNPPMTDRERQRQQRRQQRRLEWWERQPIDRMYRVLGLEPIDERALASDAITWFVKDILRAVRANNRLANRLRRLANDETRDLEIDQIQNSPKADEALRNAVTQDAMSYVKRETSVWTERDEALRDATRFARQLVLGGELTSARARRFGLRPRSSLPTFGGLPVPLSPERFKTIDNLYRLIVAYWTRSTPTHAGNERGADFGQRLAEHRANLRDDLTKQVAAAIVTTALIHGCTAIAIEDLANLKTRAVLPRATNSMLRRWSKSSIIETLTGLCELHRVHLSDVRAAYTSGFDAITGGPGIRYRISDRDAERTKRRIQTLRGSSAGSGHWPEGVRVWLRQLEALDRAGGATREITLPESVGPFFMPLDQISARPPTVPLDADENAAANIALRFLTIRPVETDLDVVI